MRPATRSSAPGSRATARSRSSRSRDDAAPIGGRQRRRPRPAEQDELQRPVDVDGEPPPIAEGPRRGGRPISASQRGRALSLLRRQVARRVPPGRRDRHDVGRVALFVRRRARSGPPRRTGRRSAAVASGMAPEPRTTRPSVGGQVARDGGKTRAERDAVGWPGDELDALGARPSGSRGRAGARPGLAPPRAATASGPAPSPPPGWRIATWTAVTAGRGPARVSRAAPRRRTVRPGRRRGPGRVATASTNRGPSKDDRGLVVDRVARRQRALPDEAVDTWVAARARRRSAGTGCRRGTRGRRGSAGAAGRRNRSCPRRTSRSRRPTGRSGRRRPRGPARARDRGRARATPRAGSPCSPRRRRSTSWSSAQVSMSSTVRSNNASRRDDGAAGERGLAAQPAVEGIRARRADPAEARQLGRARVRARARGRTRRVANRRPPSRSRRRPSPRSIDASSPDSTVAP